MKHNEIDTALKIIWGNPAFEAFTKTKAYYPQNMPKNAILFIGVNPSDSGNEAEKHLDSYPLDQTENLHPYYTKFTEIAKRLDEQWAYLDLFYFRETDQLKINKIMTSPNGAGFLFEQLKLTERRIIDAEPRVVVVANALASDFLGKNKHPENPDTNKRNEWMNLDFVFSEETGTYFWGDVPVFFSSMLNYGRLDNGSYERLAWHIDKVLKLIKDDTEAFKSIKEIAHTRKQKDFWSA